MKQMRFTGIILLLVALLGFFALVRPQIRAFASNALTAKVRSTELASYEQRLKDVKDIKAKGDAVKPTLDALYLAMPRQSQIPEVLVMMESIGANTGISFTSFSVGTPTGEEVPVSLSFNGSLNAVTNFIDGLLKNVRTAVIKTQAMMADASGTLSVTMQLGLVYQGTSGGGQ